jgi:Zn-dependent peptidase ImmA (M78 family)
MVKKCGFKEPPICENVVADCLGLKVMEIPVDDIPSDHHLNEILSTACAWLQRTAQGESRIWVSANTWPARRRMSVFHECGHAVVPWHSGLDYICNDSDIDPGTRRGIEREAFTCASEFMMPRSMFVPDALSLQTGVAAIRRLRERYQASTEATGIQYVHSNPGLCAVALVEPPELRQPATQGNETGEQTALPLGARTSIIPSQEPSSFPLRVRYFVRSRRFADFIAPGTGIPDDSPVFEAIGSNGVQVEMPISALGSRGRRVYRTEFLPLGNTGRTLVLLWLPDRQLTLGLNKEKTR